MLDLEVLRGQYGMFLALTLRLKSFGQLLNVIDVRTQNGLQHYSHPTKVARTSDLSYRHHHTIAAKSSDANLSTRVAVMKYLDFVKLQFESADINLWTLVMNDPAYL